MADPYLAAIEWTADRPRLVWVAWRSFRRSTAGSPIAASLDTWSSRAAHLDPVSPAHVRPRRDRAEGGDASVGRVYQRGGPHARVRRRGAAVGGAHAVPDGGLRPAGARVLSLARDHPSASRSCIALSSFARRRDQRHADEGREGGGPPPRLRGGAGGGTPVRGRSYGASATCACSADQEVQRLLRLHASHVLQVCSRHTADLDVGVPARGLNGEAYRGHVFWDELYVVSIPDSCACPRSRAGS